MMAAKLPKPHKQKYSNGFGCKEPLGSENWPVFKPDPNKKPHPCGWSIEGKSDWNLVCKDQVGGNKAYRDNFDNIFGKRCIKCRQREEECYCERDIEESDE